MTSQPELDLALGLPSLMPKVESKPTYGKRGDIQLEVSQSLNNPKAKCAIERIGVSSDFRQRSDYYRRQSTHLRIWITHKEASKNSVLAQYASRGLDDQDDRMAEYRAQFGAVVKHLHANGMLDFVPTLDQMENPKGFRWNQKAGCRCGCSPAFVCPDWFKLRKEDGYRLNEISVSVKEKDDAEVGLVINENRLKALNLNPNVSDETKAEQTDPF